MLQELLMAMAGTTGGVIVETQNSFSVNPQFKIFSESEKIVINQIVQLGFLYKVLKKWVDDCSTRLVEQIIAEEFKITSGLDEENIREMEDDKQVKSSKFVRAICQVFDQVLNEYYDLLLKTEQSFLYGRIANLNEFKVHFHKFFEIFPEMMTILRDLDRQELASCTVLDYLYEKKLNGNDYFKELYSKIFECAYQTFYEILVKWLTSAKLSVRAQNSFFIKKVQSHKQKKSAKTKTMDWDNDYILQFPLIPKNIVSVKTAKKILFIGKAMKILVKNDGIFTQYFSELKNYLEDLKTYDSITFPNVIEKARVLISEQFINLIVQKEGIKKDLIVVLDYFLLYKEEFYSVFIEECAPIMSLPPNKYAEYEIRNKAFQNTVMRLNKPIFEKIFKDLRYIIKSKGFEYKSFAKKHNLLLVGDLEHREGFLRLNANRLEQNQKHNFPQASVWNTIKHYLEKDFQMDFCFKFKKSFNANTDFVEPGTAEDENKNSLSLIFQAKEDILSHKQNKKIFYLDSLSEYLVINFGFLDQSNIYSNFNQKFVSFISISVKRANNPNVRLLLSKKFEIDAVNFSDQDIQFARLTYSQNILRIFLSNEEIGNTRSFNPIAEVQFRLADLISLDLGRCYVSFMNTSNNTQFNIDLVSWKLQCHDSMFQSYIWNGLVPLYNCVWPINIILNENFFDRCSAIFSFLFPLKMSKRKLSNIFYELNALKKKSIDKRNIKLLSHLRVFLDHIINSFLGYVYEDVIYKEWTALMEQFLELKDFEQLRKIINMFVDNMQNQLFFKFSDIIKDLFKFNEIVSILENLTMHEADKPFEIMAKLHAELLKQTEISMVRLIKFVTYISQSNEYYSKLLLRLNFNDFYDRTISNLQLQ